MTKKYLMIIGLLLASCDSGPKDVTYYLKNDQERKEILGRCGFNLFSTAEKPDKQDCNNAEAAQKQVDIYQLTGNQDSKDYFFSNPNMREKVLQECRDILTGKVDNTTPCTNAFNTEKEIQANILKREANGLEKVEDFIKGGDDLINKFLRSCDRNREYLMQNAICLNAKEAERKKMVIDLEKMTNGKSDVPYFLSNLKVLREVYDYCNHYGSKYDSANLIDAHPICKNAIIAVKNY